MGTELANYIGGTESDPCPTAKFFGSLYCNDNDYRSWRLAAVNMYKQGILPSWEQYAATLKATGSSTDDLTETELYQAVERYFTGLQGLPDSTLWKTSTSSHVQSVIALMQDGEVTLRRVREAAQELGAVPVELPAGPRPNVPTRSPWPWWAWALLGAAGIGGGVAIGYSIKGGK